ncbi:MAG: DUF6484 domain-containing protein [Pirellulaceae bacterium]
MSQKLDAAKIEIDDYDVVAPFTLDDVLREAPPTCTPDWTSVFVGQLLGVEEASGRVTVEVPGIGQLQPLVMVSITNEDVGRNVAIMFERGNPERPLLMGLMQMAGEHQQVDKADCDGLPDELEATLDDERLVFTADKEIVLQCGKASITLTRAGKIILRGTYLSSRSSGVNRIHGGSVQIN